MNGLITILMFVKEWKKKKKKITLFIFITKFCGTYIIPWNILTYSSHFVSPTKQCYGYE